MRRESGPAARQLLEAIIESRTGSKVQLLVRVDAGEVEHAWASAYRELGGRVRIPGFRPGHVPRPILTRFLGADVLRQEVAEHLVEASEDQALRQHGLQPVTDPEVSDVNCDEGQPGSYRLTAEVWPTVTLPPLSEVGGPLEDLTVTDEDVQGELDRLARSAAVLEPAQSATAESHLLVQSTVLVDGEPVADHVDVSHEVDMGSVTMFSEIKAGLLGAAAGDVREVAVSYPDTYADAALAGRSATIRMSVSEVKNPRVPVLDDELAQELTGLSLPDLKERVRRNLAAQRRQIALDRFTEQTVDRLLQRAEIGDLPDSAVARRRGEIERRLQEELGGTGWSVEEYFRRAGKDRQAWEAELDEQARRGVRRDVVLSEVARQAGLQVSDADLSEELWRVSVGTGLPVRKVARSMSRQGNWRLLTGEALARKALEYLVAQALTPEQQKLLARPEAAAEAEEPPDATTTEEAEQQP